MENNKKMNNKGFSLIELIVVIAIMAILVGALAPQFLKYIERTNVSTDMQNVSQLKSAVEVYVADQASQGNSIAQNVTIRVTGGASGTAVVSGNSVTAPDLGLASTSVSLKSKNWVAGPTDFVFSKDSNTWATIPNTCTNSTYNMDTIFK